MAEVTAEVVEKTAEILEESLDGVVEVVTVMRNNPVVVAAAAAAGAVVGGVGVYFIVRERLRKHYDAKAQAEVQEAHEHYERQSKTGEFATPEEALAKLHGKDALAALEEYQGESEVTGSAFASPVQAEDVLTVNPVAKEVEVTVKKTNVFKDEDPTAPPAFDPEAERKLRNDDAPFIITKKEYFENEEDFDQVDLAYFDGDGALVDDQGIPVEDIEGIVGEANLKRFGAGSGDPNVVYVCNEEKELMFCISRNGRSFGQDVLGLDEIVQA